MSPKRAPAAPAAPPKENPITVYEAWCKKCGICIAFCPKNVLDRGSDGHPAPVR
ncbi:MAG: hypothetical protein GXP50_01655, partial [Deltaproteobacteria bacterium]|nr:hypothetical protein [Deltaproteobacteria bacterium]